jgi:hypothetical protein
LPVFWSFSHYIGSVFSVGAEGRHENGHKNHRTERERTMNSSFQPMFANGLAILETLAHIWLGSAIVAGALSVTALVLAVLRRAAATVRIIGGIGCAIGLVPPVLAVSAVFGPGSGPSHSLFQFAFVILSFLPALVAAAALLISLKCRPLAEQPAGSSSPPPGA